jgi:hypothetical protein
VEVRVEYRPLEYPGVVWVRDATVWWVLIDPATPADFAAMAVENIRTIAALTEASAESEEDGARPGPAPSLRSTRRGGWTWASSLAMLTTAASVAAMIVLSSGPPATDAHPAAPVDEMTSPITTPISTPGSVVPATPAPPAPPAGSTRTAHEVARVIPSPVTGHRASPSATPAPPPMSAAPSETSEPSGHSDSDTLSYHLCHMLCAMVASLTG